MLDRAPPRRHLVGFRRVALRAGEERAVGFAVQAADMRFVAASGARVLPAGVAWVGAKIVDAVLGAIRAYAVEGSAAFRPVLYFVALEAVLVALLVAITVTKSLGGVDNFLAPYSLVSAARLRLLGDLDDQRLQGRTVLERDLVRRQTGVQVVERHRWP